MPSKDSKSNSGCNKSPSHPSYNRAFALRMMNPSSYRERKTSPFDRDIEPLPSQKIAKNISFSPQAHTNGSRYDHDPPSFSSVSPTSSLSSFHDSELYDIDENGDNPDMNREYSLPRARSMIDYHEKRTSFNGSNSDESPLFMNRSYTAVDRFNDVVKISNNKSKRVANVSAPVGATSKSKSSSKSKEDKKATDKVKTHSPVKRTKNLKDQRPKSDLGYLPRRTTAQPTPEKKTSTNTRTPVQDRQQNAVTKNKPYEPNNKSSDQEKKSCRSEPHKRSVKEVKSAPTRSSIRPSARINSYSDPSESDSSLIFNERDVRYRRSPRPRSSSSIPERKDSFNNSRDNFSGFYLQLHAPRSLSAPIPDIDVASNSHDSFSDKLAQICNLMSEKHPGEFQIIESLVEMQSAYESHQQSCRKEIHQMQQKLQQLERRLEVTENRRAPSMSAVVLPLAKATTNFQHQLIEIIKLCKSQSPALVDTGSQANSADEGTAAEISSEAMAVAEQIALSLTSKELKEMKQSPTSERSSTVSGYSSDNTTNILSQGCADGEVIVNGYDSFATPTNSALDISNLKDESLIHQAEKPLD